MSASAKHSVLVEKLACLNRKERFWLLRKAIGAENFCKLSKVFLDQISEKLDIKIPEDAWWAMDYHIDWIAAVLSTVSTNWEKDPLYNYPNKIDDDIYPIVRGTQQDFDLIIAYDDKIILCEAKGAGSWERKQINNKIERLGFLLKLAKKTKPPTAIHLLLISPGEPNIHTQLENDSNSKKWPSIILDHKGNPYWLKMEFGYGEEQLKILKRTKELEGKYQSFVVSK